MKTKYKFNIIDHTSDVGLEATGRSLQDVYENLLNGVISIMKGEYSSVNFKNVDLLFEADSNENILFDSIVEIIYQIEVKKNFPVEFKVISIDKIKNSTITKMICSLKCVHLDDVKEIKLMIKAPTYHRIELERKTDNRYFGRIILDV